MPVVINSRFTPLTYDEITRPLIEQTQAQEALENAYMEASDQASQIMAQANEQTDPIAYTRLKNYSEALQQQAESLMRQGLNRNSRQSLINMRRQYNQDIVPVKNAITRRNELMEELRKLRIQNPDMLVERDVIGIDDLLRNPQLDYGSTYNGAMITKRVADATKAVGDSMISMETAGHLTPYQIKVLEKHGFTADEIAAAVAGGQDAKSQMLAGIRNRVLGSIDVYNKGNNATKARALSYANEGLYTGIGSLKYSLAADERAKAELGWEFDKRRMDYQHTLKQRELQEQQQSALLASGMNPKFQRRNVSTMVDGNALGETNADVKARDNAISRGFIKKDNDGNWTVTEKGRKALSDVDKRLQSVRARSEGSALAVGQFDGSNEFHSFMVKIGAYNKKIRPRSSGNDYFYQLDVDKLNTIPDDVVSSGTYDSNRATEYVRQVDAANYKNIVGTIAGAAANGKITTYDMSNQDGSYVLKKGNAWDVSGLKEGDISSAHIVYGAAGNYLQLSINGDKKKILIPLSSFDANADIMLQGNAGTIAAYRQALADGYLFNSQGLPYEYLLNSELNSMGDNALSVFGVYAPQDTSVKNTYQQSTTSTN